jgi:hypothetical protein
MPAARSFNSFCHMKGKVAELILFSVSEARSYPVCMCSHTSAYLPTTEQGGVVMMLYVDLYSEGKLFGSN